MFQNRNLSQSAENFLFWTISSKNVPKMTQASKMLFKATKTVSENARMSKCQNVKMPECQNARMSKCGQ